MSAIITTIVAGTLGLIGVWVGNLLTKKTAIKLLTIQDFTKAASQFKIAFMRERIFFDKPDYFLKSFLDEKDTTFIKMTKTRIKHERAMIKFRSFLPKNIISKFDEAWDRFDSIYIEIDKHTDEKKAREKFSEGIKDLLWFTDPKNVFN